MNSLISIKVPHDSINHYINNVGCLRYEVDCGIGIMSSVILPEEIEEYLEKDKHEIVGYTHIKDDKYIIIKHKSDE